MRYERQYKINETSDIDPNIALLITREPGQRDRDRVLYSSAFRRLAGVTQVVHANEGDVYHNRLTHTLEVAQIGRRIAEYLLKLSSKKKFKSLKDHISPDVVESACLIHDLGHPPFGHVAEHMLDSLVVKAGNPDGYEGNAQSFRLITRLMPYSNDPGLNLCRATLNATLKYPWFRSDRKSEHKNRKYGAYKEDSGAFDFARKGFEGDTRSLEAQIMDLADGIAYAIHDLGDFYRAGVLDLSFFQSSRDFDKYFEDFSQKNPDAKEYKDYLRDIANAILPGAKYDGSRSGEIVQISYSSNLIAALIGMSINVKKIDSDWCLSPDSRVSTTVEFLKSIIWKYVILRPNLALQQTGQERMISDIFEFYTEKIFSKDGFRYLPLSFHSEDNLDYIRRMPSDSWCARLVADIVSGMSEMQIRRIFGKISGHDSGSISDIM